MNDKAFHPIIYVRGYAMTQSEIEDTVADPYMGFNIGSCKVRQLWDGKIKKYFFESPLVRLLKQYGYNDVYEEGADRVTELRAPSRPRPGHLAGAAQELLVRWRVPAARTGWWSGHPGRALSSRRKEDRKSVV